MAKIYDSNDELDNEVDYDFFDDNNSESSISNNNAVIKSSSDLKNLSDSDAEKSSLEKSNHDSIKSNTSKIKDSDNNDDKTSISSSSSVLSKSSKNLSKYSEKIDKEEYADYEKNSKSSTKLSNSIHHLSGQNSDSESDVTNVSSLDSENSLGLLVNRKPPKKVMKPQNSKFHTHLSSMDDIDMIPTEVILQAMMRIHEERRFVQKMKPKWIDPNTKDYSVSGITTKLNLIPERVISMPKKNIRSNPFYSHNIDVEKRLYHTAINRSKEKDRIDKENKEIELRLRRIRPSPGITKDELLREYSRLNRFSHPQRTGSRVASTTPSCRPQSSTNSTSGLKVRRTNSSTIISRYADSRQSNSRKSEPKRAVSAISLASSNTKRSNTVIH